MRKILLGMIILSVVCVSACEKQPPQPESDTNAEVEAFMRGENPEFMEFFNEQK